MSSPMHSLRRAVGVMVLVVAGCVVAGLASGLLVSVVTDGTSMLPSHRAGDFVVVARTGSYDVGQVVAYRDESSDKIVLHRIVGGDPRGYDMRGDNNASIDPTHPAAADLLGRQVLHVAKVGVAFRTPLGLALVLGTLVLAGGALVGARRRPGTSDGAISALGVSGASGASGSRGTGRGRVIALRALIVLVDLAVVGGVVASFVSRPHTVVPPAAPQHTGSLSYATSVPVDEVYPTGQVDTGDPVFLRLVDRLDVVFRYRSDASADTTASARIRADLSDGSGWSRTFDVAALTPVLGESLELRGSLDLDGMQALVERVTAATGMAAGPLSIVVSAEVDVTVGGRPSTFTTELPLQLNQLVMRVANEVVLSDGDGDGVSEVVATAPVDGDAVLAEPYETGGMSPIVRKVLFALLIVMVAVTVVAWPQMPAGTRRGVGGDIEPGESRVSTGPADVADELAVTTDEGPDPPAVRAASVAVARLVLPADAVMVELNSEHALHRLAVANGVPVFESDDGSATVITGLAVHRWCPPAATPTIELPAVVERRLFPARDRPLITDLPPDPPQLDAVVRYLGDPVVNHRAAAAEPATPVLRRMRPGEGASGLT